MRVELQTMVRLFPSLPTMRAAALLPHFQRACDEAEINTPRRLAHFAAQLGHESNDLRWVEERGNACEAYDTGRPASRLGNTPEADGDGCALRGRGWIQITGAANYAAAGKALGLDLLGNPELAATPEVAARIAAWYWRTRGLNALADRGDVVGITIRINGGRNGLEDRERRLARNLSILGVQEAS